MKTFLFFALVSLDTLACPDLQGTYVHCSSLKGIIAAPAILKVEKIDVPHLTFYRLNDLFFPANGVVTKLDEETTMYARCLGDLVQARTIVTRNGVLVSQETSQYFKQGDEFTRISRWSENGRGQFDILTCR